MSKSFDDIIDSLIIANLRDFDGAVGIYYKNYEIDTTVNPGKTKNEIAQDIKNQIYEVEKIEYPEMPSGYIETIFSKVESIKQCICTNRAHVNQSASTMSEKALLLEKLSYNIETKVDTLISEIDEFMEKQK